MCGRSLPRCRCRNGHARSAGSQAGLGLLPLLEHADRNLLLKVGGVPDQEQRVLDVRTIPAKM